MACCHQIVLDSICQNDLVSDWSLGSNVQATVQEAPGGYPEVTVAASQPVRYPCGWCSEPAGRLPGCRMDPDLSLQSPEEVGLCMRYGCLRRPGLVICVCCGYMGEA